MIHYQLRCAGGHAFDGWFRDSVGFDRLAEAGLVECPTCGGTRVARALMAPAIGRAREAAPARPPEPEMPAPQTSGPQVPAPQASAPPPSPAGLPAEMMAVLQRMRAQVEKNCDYVGPGFAEEARRLHAGEGEGGGRGIYGEASEAEAEALRDEGVEVVRLPWVPRADG